MTRLGLVVNPTAGRGRGADLGRLAHAALAAHGLDVTDLSAPTLAQATDQARAAALAGLDALVVVGGDGMAHLGVNVTAGTGLALGIVPAGTGNDIARALGIPRDGVRPAVDTLVAALSAGPRTIDAVQTVAPGAAAAEWYVGVLSCGLDAAVNARANRSTWPRGQARYVRALAAELGGFRPYGYRVVLDDEVWLSAGSVVAVANTGWFGAGMQIAPQALPDDGLLDVIVAGPLSRSQVLRVFPRIYGGSHLTHPAVRTWRARTVTIEPHPQLGPHPPAAYADGERLGTLPLRVTVVPGALHVLALPGDVAPPA